MSTDNIHDARTTEQVSSQTKEQLDFLHTAAEDLARSRTIDTEERVEAIEIATRLAESLTASGSAHAAAHARNVLETLHHPGLPQPERLQQQVGALRETLGLPADES